jgi:hypothetical protein
MKPLLPSHVRWSWNGGRPIHLGDQPAAGEIVVTGSGQFSHRTLSCAALHDGRHRAISKGWASGGFYAVTKELADRYVTRCRVCWSDPPPTLEDNPMSASYVPGTSGTAGKRITTTLRFEQLMLPPFCAANDDAPDDQASSQPGSSG